MTFESLRPTFRVPFLFFPPQPLPLFMLISAQETPGAGSRRGGGGGGGGSSARARSPRPPRDVTAVDAAVASLHRSPPALRRRRGATVGATVLVRRAGVPHGRCGGGAARRWARRWARRCWCAAPAFLAGLSPGGGLSRERLHGGGASRGGRNGVRAARAGLPLGGGGGGGDGGASRRSPRLSRGVAGSR